MPWVLHIFLIWKLVSGTRNTDRQEEHDYLTVDNLSPDIGEPVLDDIHYHSQYSSLHNPGEYDELRKSPVKLTRKPQQLDVPGKLEGMPSNFIADIDFAEALKEVKPYIYNPVFCSQIIVTWPCFFVSM